MNIGIIGGGSIGLLVSSYLSRTHQVTLYVHREEQKKYIDENGVTYVKDGRKHHRTNIKARKITDMKIEDCYIVCVKQHHLVELLPCLHKIKNPIIFLQNGMGHLKYVQQLQIKSFVGVVEHGANRKNDGLVHHLGNGVIKLASIDGDKITLQKLTEKLNDVHFPFLLEVDYKAMLKKKLIINAVINPLTAIFNVPNGSVVENKHIERLARCLCAEAAKTLQLDEKRSWKHVVETAMITQENTSSMRADIINKRKTEIEAISGYLLEQTRDLPYTHFAYESVLALEKEGTYVDEHTTNI